MSASPTASVRSCSWCGVPLAVESADTCPSDATCRSCRALPNRAPIGAWVLDSACAGKDMQPEEATPDDVGAALDLCNACPVVQHCRRLAESEPAAYGVYAGEWWGDPPRNPAFVLCGWCETELEPGRRGTRTYCGATCRKRAQRARQEAAS